MFKPKLQQQEQGFTLVEVLVAILITIVFTAVALQVMVFAAVFKVRAQEFAEATTWIQENLEDVKYQASQYTNNTRCAPTSPSPNNGYADGLRDNVSGITPETSIINSVPEDNSITFSKTSRTGKPFTITRITTPSDTFPYNVLKVTYDVSPTSGGGSVANLYTEVIPNAALQCL